MTRTQELYALQQANTDEQTEDLGHFEAYVDCEQMMDLLEAHAQKLAEREQVARLAQKHEAADAYKIARLSFAELSIKLNQLMLIDIKHVA